MKLLELSFIFHQQFHFVFSGLKIIGHGNPGNNLESPYIKTYHICYICQERDYVNQRFSITFDSFSFTFLWYYKRWNFSPHGYKYCGKSY
jgi:hypothetical protein